MKSILQSIKNAVIQSEPFIHQETNNHATVIGTLVENPLHFNNQVRILYVEDNVINQTIGIKVLKNLGCVCDIANSGQEALEMLVTKQYDLVFMDINMPVMDGMETTRQIRKQLQLQIPIIAITTSISIEDVKNCMEAGMNDHVGKPYTQHQLSRVIFNWCTISGVKY